MAIIYRTSGAWGAGQGSDLTALQLDGNFFDHDGRIEYLETNPPVAVSIDHFEMAGDQFYVHLIDSTILGPYQLPIIEWNFRGPWLPATSYLVYDVVTESNAVYLVVFDHTSDASFDAGANDGLGNDYYNLLLAAPSGGAPGGGATGEVLTKVSATDYDFAWEPAPSSTSAVASVVGTAITLALGDELAYKRFTNASGCEITIPTNADEAFAIDTEIHIRAATAGPVTFATDSGVILNVPAGFEPQLHGEGATATIKKVDDDEWDLMGLLLRVSGA
jgi:hypothetical protein